MQTHFQPENTSYLRRAIQAIPYYLPTYTNQDSALDEVTGEIVRLFHPRRDDWEEHFRLVSEAGLNIRLTLIGRASITLLRMNRGAQREARRVWTRLGNYPKVGDGPKK